MWKEYFKKHAKRKPRKLLVIAVSFCKKRENALDLGSGTLIESKFLIRKGFKKVIAIDSSRDAKVYSKNLSKKIEFKNISFQKYNFPKETFDFINAQYALPFYRKKNFNSFMDKVKNSLKPGGIFVGQFFGNKDGWNDGRQNLVFHTKKQALHFLSSMEILKFIENEKDGETASGKMRHWHVFHFIVRKKK